jgi:hypothetical protein
MAYGQAAIAIDARTRASLTMNDSPGKRERKSTDSAPCTIQIPLNLFITASKPQGEPYPIKTIAEDCMHD